MFNESGNSFLKGTCGIFDRNMFGMETNFGGGQVQKTSSPKASITFASPNVFTFIHNNPVKAGLCKFSEDYKYSSARFYEKNEKDWVFVTHHEG